MKTICSGKYIIGFCSSAAFILLTCIIYYSLSMDYLRGDIFGEGIPVQFDFFLHPVHGRYFGEILERIIGFANLAGIHPMDFINTGLAFIKALIYAFLCYLTASSIYIFRKKDIFFPFYMLLIYMAAMRFECVEMMDTARFFGYTAQILFLLAAWNTVIKLFTEKNLPSEKNKIIKYSVLAFFLGMASEYMNISFLFLMIFTALFYIAAQKPKFADIKHIMKKIAAPSALFFISFIAAYSNSRFWQHLYTEKGFVFSFDFFISKFADFKAFFSEYYKCIIFDNREFLIPAVCLLLIILILAKDKEKAARFVLVIFFIICSIFLFFSVFIICGKEWLSHTGMLNLLRISLIYLSACSFGFLTAGGKLISSKAGCMTVQIILFCLIFCRFLNPEALIKKLEYNNKINLEVRRKIYKLDKMILFYFSQNKDAYIPETLKNIIVSMGLYHETALSEYKYYIENVYNNRNMLQNEIKAVNDYDAWEKFRSEGGVIKEEELILPEFGNLKKEYLKQKSIYEKKLEQNEQNNSEN